MKKIWWYLLAGLIALAVLALTLIGLIPKGGDRKTIRELVDEQEKADKAKDQVRAEHKEQQRKVDVVYHEHKQQLRQQLHERLKKIEQESKTPASQKEAFDKEAAQFESELDRELRQEGDV